MSQKRKADLLMGVEEEFLLVDSEGQLRSAAPAVLSEARRREYRFVDREVFAAMIEIKTLGAETHSGALAEKIVENRAGLAEIVKELGLDLMACGMHPNASPTRLQIAQEPRYLGFASEMGLRFQAFTGIHVHVGFESLEDLSLAFRAVRWHIPTLIALSVNSPFSLGEPCGYRSKRLHVFSSWKRAGLPPSVRSSDEYARLIGRLSQIGVISSERDLWFDVRPRLQMKTIEYRCFDAQPNAFFSVALACFVRALSTAALHDAQRLEAVQPVQSELALAANRYLAYRDGLSAVFCYGDGCRIPASDVALTTLRTLQPHLLEADDGSSCDRMCRHIQAGDLAERALARYAEERAIPFSMMMLDASGRDAVAGKEQQND